MKLLIFSIFLAFFLAGCGREVQPVGESDIENREDKNIIEIVSSAFKNNELIPSKYTCDGENVNPTLVISNVPDKTQDLVLIVDDPDAPGGDWVHWLIWKTGVA